MNSLHRCQHFDAFDTYNKLGHDLIAVWLTIFNKLEHDLIADWLTIQQIGAWPHCWLVDLPEFVILRLLVELIRWMFLFGRKMISCPITLQNSNETLLSSCNTPVRSINELECEFMAGYRMQADISCYTGIRKKSIRLQRYTCKLKTSYENECNELLAKLQLVATVNATSYLQNCNKLQ